MVLQVRRSGGFAPQLFQRTYAPEFTLYGDGTLIYIKLDSSGYPVLLKGKLSEEAVQELLRLVVSENRFFNSKPNYNIPWIADGTITTILVNAERRSLTVEIYGLEAAPTEPREPFSQEDVDQLARLKETAERLRAMDLRVIDDPDYQDLGEFVPERITLYVERSQGNYPEAKPWPIQGIELARLAKDYRMGQTMVEGDLLVQVLSILQWRRPNPFVENSQVFTVDFRPSLPHEWRWNGGAPEHITNLFPGDGQTVTQEELKDGIALNWRFRWGPGMGNNPTQSVRLFLDNTEVTNGLSWMTTKDLPPSFGTMRYVPPQPLSDGEHTARVTYTDAEGTQYSYTWRFNVGR